MNGVLGQYLLEMSAPEDADPIGALSADGTQACWTNHSHAGLAVTPTKTLRVSSSMKNGD